MKFELYSKLYDKINSGKDYQKEVEYILSKFLKPDLERLSIIELGSGTGKHAQELVRLGHKVDGVEISAEMISNGFISNSYRVRNEDIINHSFTEKYDLAISLFHVMSYILDDNDINKVFQKTRDNLKKNCLFMFDTWFTPAVYSIKPSSRIVKYKDDQNLIIRTSNSKLDYFNNTVLVDFNFDFVNLNSSISDSFSEQHVMRHFSIPEIKNFAEANDFRLVNASEFMTNNPLSVETWGAFFILEAI